MTRLSFQVSFRWSCNLLHLESFLYGGSLRSPCCVDMSGEKGTCLGCDIPGLQIVGQNSILLH
jgi:hypothetical protein